MLTQLVGDNREIKSHISKLTSSLTINEKGNFSSQPQNFQGQHMVQCSIKDKSHLQQVNAINTLKWKKCRYSNGDLRAQGIRHE